MSDKECTKRAEQLAAYADDGLDDDEAAGVRAHVAGCAACESEVRELRRLLGAVVETRPRPLEAGKDERFWSDFGRGVRLAYEESEAARGRGLLAWLGRPLVVACFAGVAGVVLLVAWLGRERAPEAPVAVEKSVPPAAPAPLPAVDEYDLDEGQLRAVLADLEGDEEDSEVDSLVGAALPDGELDGLDDAELDRVLAALAKGV